MVLATLIATQEDELICDLAETYHILNYRELPVKLLGTLVAGLPEHSRTKLKLNNVSMSQNDIMLISILDRLNILVWQKTKDGQKGKNKPKLILGEILKPSKKEDIETFTDGDSFDRRRKELIGGISDGK